VLHAHCLLHAGHPGAREADPHLGGRGLEVRRGR
jgi:hypothetical protein